MGAMKNLLLEQLEQARPHKGLTCAVAVMLNKIKPEEVEGVRRLIEDSEKPEAAAWSRVFRNNGYTVSDDSIRRHRRKGCLCR
jgi:hypothetical protein